MVRLKRTDGFPLECRLHDMWPQGLRVQADLPVAMGKDFELAVAVYLGGQHYGFSALAHSVACTLSGRGFLVEVRFTQLLAQADGVLREVLDR
jgi:hypothetical protein